MNEPVDLVRGQWTLLNETSATAATLQNIGNGIVQILATDDDENPPDEVDTGLRLYETAIIPSIYTLAELFPGSEDPGYIWARCAGRGGRVFISYA